MIKNALRVMKKHKKVLIENLLQLWKCCNIQIVKNTAVFLCLIQFVYSNTVQYRVPYPTPIEARSNPHRQ
jgi:hypothetical protein